MIRTCLLATVSLVSIATIVITCPLSAHGDVEPDTDEQVDGLSDTRFFTVEFASGRRLTGQIDAATDRHDLWLRFTTAGMIVRRPVAWQNVISARQADRTWTRDELRDQAELLASPADTDPALTKLSSKTAEQVAGPNRTARSSLGEWTPPQPVNSGPVRQAASLDVTARVANWNSTVESDGLELRVTVLDADGLPMPVSGTLQAEWIAPRPVALVTRRYLIGRHLGPPYVRAGQWSRALSIHDDWSDGVTVRLPFQAEHPDFDLDLGDLGLVNVRLAVPGQGVLNASDAAVVLRPFSHVRNVRERLYGTRFFPIERTDRGQ